MNNLRFVPMALVLALLGGCASTSKPVMSDAQYSSVAWEWYAVSRCGTGGKMDLDTASLGKAYLQRALDNHAFDANQMQVLINQINQKNVLPTQEQCNDLAMKILDIKRGISLNNENVAANQRATQEFINSTKIKNTYCNRIGTSTLCNTY